jgi:two-component system response regulator
MKKQFHPGAILVADDDVDQHFLIHKALKEIGADNPVYFLGDGQELIDHLNDHLNSPSPEKPLPLPSLILLDLNMPRMDGYEALKIVKEHEQWKEIPVVVLSTSRNPDDVSNSYEKGANSFFTKPMDYRELVVLMDLLKTYWFRKSQPA